MADASSEADRDDAAVDPVEVQTADTTPAPELSRQESEAGREPWAPPRPPVFVPLPVESEPVTDGGTAPPPETPQPAEAELSTPSQPPAPVETAPEVFDPPPGVFDPPPGLFDPPPDLSDPPRPAVFDRARTIAPPADDAGPDSGTVDGDPLELDSADPLPHVFTPKEPPAADVAAAGPEVANLLPPAPAPPMTLPSPSTPPTPSAPPTPSTPAPSSPSEPSPWEREATSEPTQAYPRTVVGVPEPVPPPVPSPAEPAAFTEAKVPAPPAPAEAVPTPARAAPAPTPAPAAPAPPPAQRLPKMEPGHTAIHRVRSGLVLVVSAVIVGLAFAAAVGLSISALVVTLNRAINASSSTPAP